MKKKITLVVLFSGVSAAVSSLISNDALLIPIEDGLYGFLPGLFFGLAILGYVLMLFQKNSIWKYALWLIVSLGAYVTAWFSAFGVLAASSDSIIELNWWYTYLMFVAASLTGTIILILGINFLLVNILISSKKVLITNIFFVLISAIVLGVASGWIFEYSIKGIFYIWQIGTGISLALLVNGGQPRDLSEIEKSESKG